LRFTLSYRDVEELLAERGLDISYETARCWVLKIRTGDRATATPLPPTAEQRVAPG
jgi:transposase-like protein